MFSAVWRLLCLFVVGLALAAVACTTTSTSTTTIPLSAQHLYVTDGVDPSTIYVYNLPISPTSTPTVTLITTVHKAQNPCLDGAGHLYVPSLSDGTVQVFNLPLTSSSIKAFSLTAGTQASDCHFDPAGNMYAATTGSTVSTFGAPVQAGSNPGTPISNQVSFAWGAWTDPAGDVFVADENDVTEYSSLAASNSLLAKFGTIVSGFNFNAAIGPNGSLYVPNGSALNKIDVYDPPFTNSSAPNAAKTITVQALTATNFLTWVTFDRAGNLYVGARDNTTFDNHVYVIPPPYTSVSVNLDTDGNGVRGVAIGP